MAGTAWLWTPLSLDRSRAGAAPGVWLQRDGSLGCGSRRASRTGAAGAGLREPRREGAAPSTGRGLSRPPGPQGRRGECMLEPGKGITGRLRGAQGRGCDGRAQPARGQAHGPAHPSTRLLPPGAPASQVQTEPGAKAAHATAAHRGQDGPQRASEEGSGNRVAPDACPGARGPPAPPGAGQWQPASFRAIAGGPVSPHHPPPAPPGSATASLPVTRPFLLQHQRGSNLQPKSERYRICHQKPSQVTPPPGRDSAAGCLCWLV